MARLDTIETSSAGPTLRLNPRMTAAPDAGIPFTAVLIDGRSLRVERMDDGRQDFATATLSILPAPAFAGWMEEPPVYPGLHPLTEREEAALYHFDEIEIDRLTGEEIDPYQEQV